MQTQRIVMAVIQAMAVELETAYHCRLMTPGQLRSGVLASQNRHERTTMVIQQTGVSVNFAEALIEAIQDGARCPESKQRTADTAPLAPCTSVVAAIRQAAVRGGDPGKIWASHTGCSTLEAILVGRVIVNEVRSYAAYRKP